MSFVPDPTPPAVLLDQGQQQVVVRVRVAEVLAEAFGGGDADGLAARASQAARASRYSSIPCCWRSQSRWLAWQASIRRLRSLKRETSTVEVGRDRAVVAVDAAEWVRRSRGGGSGPSAGRVPTGGSCSWASVTPKQASRTRRLVASWSAVVVDRRGGQDEVGAGAADRLDDAAARLVVVEHGHVAEFEADVLGAEEGGRLARLPRGGRRRWSRRRGPSTRSRPGSSSPG